MVWLKVMEKTFHDKKIELLQSIQEDFNYVDNDNEGLKIMREVMKNHKYDEVLKKEDQTLLQTVNDQIIRDIIKI